MQVRAVMLAPAAPTRARTAAPKKTPESKLTAPRCRGVLSPDGDGRARATELETPPKARRSINE
jgi:hypothetical protein